MYLFSPEPYKSRCGPEGSVCFTMFLHSHLHSQQAVCGPYALYSSFQRKPCRSEVEPFTLGMGRDEQTCVQKTEKAIWGSILQAFSFQYYWVFLFCLFVRYWLQLTISFNSVLSANCLHLTLYQPKKHPHLLFKTSSKQLLIQGENWVNSGFRLWTSLTLSFFFLLLSFCVGVTFLSLMCL